MVREMTKRLKYRGLSKDKQSNNGSYTRSSPAVRELTCPQSVSEELTASVIGDSQKIFLQLMDEYVACFMWVGSALSKIIEKAGNLTSIPNHFGKHYSTISRIVNKDKYVLSKDTDPSVP